MAEEFTKKQLITPRTCRFPFAKTPVKLKVAMPDILENAEANLTPRMRNLASLLWTEWKDLEQQIVGMNQEIEQIASSIRPASG